MKTGRMIAIIIAILLITGCGSTNTTNQPSIKSETQPQKRQTAIPTLMLSLSETQPISASTNESEGNGIEVYKGLFNVTVTFPASIIESLQSFDESFTAEELGKGDNSVVNPDGSVTITMSRKEYEESLIEYRRQVEQSLIELINSETAPFIKNITHDDNYRKITVVVNGTEYKDAFLDFSPFLIGFSVSMYHVFSGNEVGTEITYLDVDTQEVLNVIPFPPQEDQK